MNQWRGSIYLSMKGSFHRDTCLGNRRVFPRVSVQTSRPHFAHRVHRCYYANVFYLGRFLCHCYALLCFACLLVLIHDSSMSPVCGYSNQAAGSCYYNDRQGDPNQSGRLRRTNKVTRSSDNTTRSSKVSKYLAPGAIRSGS